ncbi:MAG: hypothetical protein KAI29_02140, partial [Cyclobacteriaceae bacterium]|nr:hypothetical protein [Cyclobacteriaceae bacterium]
MSFLFFIIASFGSFSQNPDENFQAIDQNTYLLYTQKNWDSLIVVGKHSLKTGTDYYYLRLRMGIAYYNKGNYLKAIQHLEKALDFNASDASVQEYLYYSYLFSNQIKEARVLSSKFNTSLENKLQTGKINFFEKLYLETGPTFSNNIDQNRIQRPDLYNNDTYQEQDLNDDKYYTHFGFEINLSNRISAYLGYSFLSISKLKQIIFPGLFPPGNSNIGPFYNYEYKLFQNEFYGNLKFFLGSGFTITPAYHFINVKYTSIYPDNSSQPFSLFNVVEGDISFNNNIISLSVNKNLSLFNLGITSSWSNLNNKYQYQLGGIFTWYPVGNMNIYTTTLLVSAWEEEN